MKSFPALSVISVAVFCLQTLSTAQIYEELVPVPEPSAATSVQKDSSPCFPQCRAGFFCSEGTCISRCNPPCPEGMDCGDDGECHPRMTTIQRALREIDEIAEVWTREELVQGVVIRSNKRNARVRILDTTFICDGELFLNVPKGEYDIFVDAPGYFINEEDFEVRLGTIDTVEVKLRPFQFYGGLAFGVSTTKQYSQLVGEANVGIGLSTELYVGVIGMYMGPLFEEVATTGYKDPDITDTLRIRYKELMGVGVAVGFIGIKPIVRKIKIIPQVVIGYWYYDDQTYYKEQFPNGREEFIQTMERHTTEKYYFAPTLGIRIGERLFNFEGRIAGYLGTGSPVFTFTAGFQVAVPR